MIYEITGFIALLMIGVGLGLQYGLPAALIVSGAILLIMSMIGAKNTGH